MGSCTRRHFLLSICVLQLLTIVQRQVFDFLGFMWAPILANFFNIIFVIFGIFGAYQFRAKYIITYSIWNILWMGWNSFLICFYLNVGILDRDSDLLNLGTGSVSWFEVNGYGCKPVYPTNITSEDPYRPVRPEHVDNCFVDYSTIEIIQAGLQCFLAVVGIISAICIGQIFMDEDDRSSRCSGSGKSKSSSKQRQSLYSIEFSRPVDTIRRHQDDLLEYHQEMRGPSLSPKPMTPRRVKRRSVMARGTNGRQSTTSRRSHGASGSGRNSTRNSRRKVHSNPVNKLMEQQQAVSKSYPTFKYPAPPDAAAILTANNLKTLNKEIIATSSNNFNLPVPYQANMNTDPIYYNMTVNNAVQQRHQSSIITTNTSISDRGHFNPTYQHSTPNLSQNPDGGNAVDELYNNRPPSVRSSYSNFHGARPLSSYNPRWPKPDESNVFAEIFSGHSAEHNPPTQSQAIPQVPSRRSASRESVRSMAFLSSGPPAYNLNYHTPPDSETTM